MRYFLIIPITLFLLLTSSAAQNLPLEVKFSAGHINILDRTRSAENTGIGAHYLGLPDSIDGGFNFSGEFRYKFTEKLKGIFRVSYDNQRLYQDDVLTEWNWPYWEDTYLEFIGARGNDLAEVNRTLRYESNDGIYSAVFEPIQSLKELRLSIGASWSERLLEKWQVNAELSVGASLYTRELRMDEHWIKRFKLDSTSTEEYDYNYDFDLTHFAPPKDGTRFFIAPALGVTYTLSPGFDLELDGRMVGYIDRDLVEPLEKLFNIPAGDQRDFPVYYKMMLQFGLVIKY